MTGQDSVSVARCDYGEVRVETVSLAQGEPLTVHVDWGESELHIVVVRVEELEDQWVLSGNLNWDRSAPGTGHSKTVGDQPPGLYKLAAMYQPSIQSLSSHKPLTPSILFEVRAASETPRTAEDLAAAHQAVLESRKRQYLAGIGEGPVTASVVVFVKNLLMTTPINLGTWEIVPIGYLGWSTELQVVERELRALGVSIPSGSTLIREASLTWPAVLIKFPRVRGDSLEACGNRAMNEVDLLLPILAAHRDSRGETFFVVVIGQNETLHMITAPRYRGNLLGGFISGEAPEQIRRNMAAVKRHPNRRLFVSLLGEAIREDEPAFRYVRLWSLLETIAQARGHSGASMHLTWNGSPKINAQGKPVTVSGAKAKVLRLLHELLTPQGRPWRTYEIPHVQYGAPVDQIGIWYRRRNCVAHGDPGCICRDRLKRNAKDEYQICLAARRDDQSGRDQYLWSLEEMAKDVIFKLLA